MRLLTIWIINAAALLVLPYIFSSIQIKNAIVALLTALVLGLLNTLVRPILVLLTLPITIVTLGLFILVINALLFWLVASVIDGFYVAGFWAAFWGAIVYSLITWAATALILGTRK